MITNLAAGTTGLHAIDEPIKKMVATGYMHNHARMYVASLACNIGQAHWLNPSRWMYYHLLDGDIASDSLSWQWVAGTFSNKKYYFNQENLNRFSETVQTGTFMDCGYDNLDSMPIPESLTENANLPLTCNLPLTTPPELDLGLPLLIYNSYNIDPAWRSDMPANRVLLLEPSHFKSFPVSDHVLRFVITTAQKLVPGIQVVTGEFNEIPGLEHFTHVYFKDHPISRHYRGERDNAAWMFPEVEPKSSFSAYWKACEKRSRKNATDHVVGRAMAGRLGSGHGCMRLMRGSSVCGAASAIPNLMHACAQPRPLNEQDQSPGKQEVHGCRAPVAGHHG